MKNALKLITDKTEYTCNSREQIINITNLNELGATDVFLSPDSINKYPIKSIDGENITIDVSNIDNNTSKMFRVFAKVDLPKLEIVDMPKYIEQNVTYQVKVMKKNWYNTSVNQYSLHFITTIGELEELYLLDGSMYFNIISETSEYFLYEFKIRNAELPPGEYKMSFKIASNVNSQSKNFLCETELETFYVTPCLHPEDFHEAVYLDKSEFLFEAGQKYRLQIQSDVLLTDTIARVHFNTNPSSTLYVDVVDGNFIEFTMPVISGLANGHTNTFGLQVFRKPTDGSTPSYDTHLACSNTYNFMYYKL